MPLLKTNIVLFFFLAIATFASLSWVNRYQQIGPDLLTSHWTTTAFGGNRVDISDNEITLFSTNPRAIALAQQSLAEFKNGSVLLFSAEMKSNNVVSGRKPWNRARLILVQNDGKKDRWNLPLTVTTLKGTHDWENYQNFFYITPETQSIRVIAELNQSTGFFQIRNMQLFPVHETKMYWWIKNIILISWSAFFILLIGSCLFAEKRSMIFQILLASAFIAIVIGTSLPGYMKTFLVYEVETQIDEISPTFTDIVPWDLTKVWHACIFFLLGMALSLMMKKVPLTQVMVIIMMMAGGTEIMQLYIDGRTPLISDFFIDSGGGLVGTLLIKPFIKNKPELALHNSS